VEAYDPESGSWTGGLAPMPTPRWLAAAAVVDGRIYVVGGAGDEDYTPTAAVEAYDPATDSWQVLADLPSALWGPAAAAADGKIYVIGGGSGDPFGERDLSAGIQVYDPATDGWDLASDMTTARAFAGVAVMDGLVYVAGGSTNLTTGGGALKHSVTGELEVYDPQTDSWTLSSPMAEPRTGHALAAVDGRLLAFGGFSADDRGAYSVAPVEAFDPFTRRWREETVMPNPRWGVGAAVVDGTVHLIGGGHGTPHLSGAYSVDSYDPDLYTQWTEIAAHLAGSSGSQWRTDICAINENGDPAQVEVVFHGASGDSTMQTEIGSKQQRPFADLVGSMGLEDKGMVEVRSNQPLLVSGRTYSDEGDGTYGQACEFGAMDDGFGQGETARLVGLRQEVGVARTNITVANGGIRPATVVLKLYACDGTELLTYGFLTIPVGEARQLIEPFVELADEPNLGWGYATVQVVSGAGVLASASVIDSRTNDATTVRGRD
jgi:N-acetylneuraminic acid mutarotase